MLHAISALNKFSKTNELCDLFLTLCGVTHFSLLAKGTFIYSPDKSVRALRLF